MGVETSGGTILASDNLSCDYSQASPCPTGVDHELLVDTTQLPDGVHTLRVFVDEAGGPASRVTGADWQVEVENDGSGPTPPPGPPPAEGGGVQPPSPAPSDIPFLLPGIVLPQSSTDEGEPASAVDTGDAREDGASETRRSGVKRRALVIRAPKGRVIQVRLVSRGRGQRLSAKAKRAGRVLTTRKVRTKRVPTLMPVSGGWAKAGRRAQWRLLPARAAKVRRPGPWRNVSVKRVSRTVLLRATPR